MARVKTRSRDEVDFPAYWGAVKDRLETELARWIPKFFGDLSAGQIKTIRAVLADGKRIRGSLVCLMSDALAVKVGAIAAGASSAMKALAFEWGARVGEAFQIADDLEEIATFAARPKTLAASIPRLAPLYLCFSKATNFDSSCLAAGRAADFCAWFRNARPTIESRMLDEIAARLDLAAKALQDFPEAADTRLLRAAPSDIVRSGIKKIRHSKKVSNCGR